MGQVREDMTDESRDPAANVREVVHPDPEQALWGFRHAPCFRESALYSIVIASVFSGVELYRKRPPYTIKNRLLQMTVPAAEAVFVGTFVSTSLGTWLLCRYQLRDRRDKMHDALRFRSVNAEHQERVAASGGVVEPCAPCDQQPLSTANAASAQAAQAQATHTPIAPPTPASAPTMAAAATAPKPKRWWQLW